MKLLTTSGLLYAAANSAATTDGNYGAYTMIDWAVTFEEAYLAPVGAIYAPTATQTIGLSPAVTALLVTADGGKLLAGYGVFDNMTTFGWAIKLFGEQGAVTGCAVGDKPTGYATFASYPNNVKTTSTCTTGVQWSYLQANANIAAMAKASVYLGLAEDYLTSTSATSFFLIGGIEAQAAYGLGSWSQLLVTVDADGVLSTPTGHDADGYADNTHANTNVAVLEALEEAEFMGTQYGTSGCMTAADGFMYTTAAVLSVVVGGSSAMQRTCLDWAIDGYLIDGIPTVYAFWGTGGLTFAVDNTASYVYKINTDDFISDYASGPTNKDANLGGITQVVTQMKSSDNANRNFMFLMSGKAEYCDSNIFGIKKATMVTASVLGTPLPKATVGTVRAFWAFCAACTSAVYTADYWDQAALVGTKDGKGVITSVAITNASAGNDITIAAPSSNIFSNTTWCTLATGYCAVKGPTGGIAQFKGLTQSTTEDKYVEVVCTGVQPYYGATRWQNISAATGGFVITCMTGISSCVDHQQLSATTTPTGYHPLSASERTSCLQDPRYLTWRMMTLKIAYDGAQTWYRTDSHWDAASLKVGSTWGPGIKISTHIHTDKDNDSGSTTTTLGKTYVFAFGDGTGISLNHLSYATLTPTTNATVGAGTNTIIQAQPAFKNVDPYLYEHNYCADTNVLLEGTTDTAALSSDVAAFSDGYQLTSTMINNTIFAGSIDGWRGTCLVYHQSQYIQDATSGTVCHVVQRDGTATAGPQDWGAQYVLHIPATIWEPGTQSGPIKPADYALTNAKYGINLNPLASTKYLLTDGFYSTAKWYQPSLASTYTDLARYGKADWVAAYCMQGTGTTSYFIAPDSAVQLTGGAALVAGAALIATTVLAL